MILPFSIPSPDVQYFMIGTFPLYIYALCIIAAIVCAAIWTSRRLQKRGGERGAIFDFVVWSFVLGIVGARTYHVLTHWGFYFGSDKNFFDVFAIREGGIAIFGALIGGGVGVLIASRLTGIRFWSFADALVPGLLLAQAVGRIGNWFNHELFGGPTTLPWGLEIEVGNPAFPVGLPEATLFHPTFLYEALWNLLGIVILLAIERKWRPRWGAFFAMYLVWYGVGRAFVESLRVDPSLLFLGLRTNVLAALLAILIGIVLFFVQRRRHVGIETSVYLPGRRNPADNGLEGSANLDEYYHVVNRGDGLSEEFAELTPAASGDSAEHNEDSVAAVVENSRTTN
jgi:prolipoprotein diacylglyceryl transferase